MTREPRQAFDPVADALDAEGVELRISGSVASSALGVGRSTLNVDLVADLRAELVEGLGGDTDRVFPLTTSEDVILRKLEWYERGDRVSERQWSDVLGVLRVQGLALNLANLRHWAVELGLAELLDSALAEAGLGA